MTLFIRIFDSIIRLPQRLNIGIEIGDFLTPFLILLFRILFIRSSKTHGREIFVQCFISPSWNSCAILLSVASDCSCEMAASCSWVIALICSGVRGADESSAAKAIGQQAVRNTADRAKATILFPRPRTLFELRFIVFSMLPTP